MSRALCLTRNHAASPSRRRHAGPAGLLSPHGRLVIFGASAGQEGKISLQSLYGKGIQDRSVNGKLVLDTRGA
jgi:hypothetical protein